MGMYGKLAQCREVKYRGLFFNFKILPKPLQD
jgi:hypothetical protein